MTEATGPAAVGGSDFPKRDETEAPAGARDEARLLAAVAEVKRRVAVEVILDAVGDASVAEQRPPLLPGQKDRQGDVRY